VEVAGGYHLVTRPECSPWIKRLEKVKSGLRLSKPALETLAIIAYKQPVIRAEIEQIRGVDSMGVIKTLLERHLIKINGRRDAVGRPIVYGTTKDFLMNFGLKSLSELPTLRDFQEIAKSEGEGDDENDSKIENGNGISPSLETVDKGNVEEEEEADIISEELRLETHVPS
jgi:segregation and condensation protein B